MVFWKINITATDETSCDCVRSDTATEETIIATNATVPAIHESDETIPENDENDESDEIDP